MIYNASNVRPLVQLSEKFLSDLRKLVKIDGDQLVDY